LPPLLDPRESMVVLVEGENLAKANAVKPILVIEDSRFVPPVLPVATGTTVTFINKDAELHLLEANPGALMTARSVPAGDSTSQTFAKDGVYEVRCSEVPHVVATVLVTDLGATTVPDNNGAFRFPNLPPGSYALRIWYHGWIYRQPVTVRGRTSIDVLLPTKHQE